MLTANITFVCFEDVSPQNTLNWLHGLERGNLKSSLNFPALKWRKVYLVYLIFHFTINYLFIGILETWFWCIAPASHLIIVTEKQHWKHSRFIEFYLLDPTFPELYTTKLTDSNQRPESLLGPLWFSQVVWAWGGFTFDYIVLHLYIYICV